MKKSPQIVDLVRAVGKMKSLGENDCRNWDNLAAIHGTEKSGHECGPNEPWNNCQHANYYFLAWHRMYIASLERLVQQYSGDPDFRMPYWNWAPANGNNKVPVPDLFSREELLGAANPLWAYRRPAVYDQSREVAQAFASTVFSQNYDSASGPPSFGGYAGAACQEHAKGSLEGSAHDNIHCEVGGQMFVKKAGCGGPPLLLAPREHR